MGGLRREIMLEVLFDSHGALCGHRVQAGSGAGAVSARYRGLFEHAFRMQASGLVLVHNHPSGDPRPSSQDIAETRRLAAMAHVLDLDFHDHVVVGGPAAVSMRRAGLMGPAKQPLRT
ncbi:JAB domain-containing protein [Novosphingobium beihaiensis]|uniref:DNA repair protein RadC n=1 Tax=Novosphingobium beihaiensis TaxID=2930389 RepID=A0ABT0BV97_9SPHN|nr:DNA repair protein RadC [Novosphingobium beihaiensis]